MDLELPPPARKVVTRSPGRTVRRINLPAIFNAPVECESTLERDFVMRAALCLGVAQLKHQPFQLELANGKRYTPDFFVQSNSGEHRVVEIKMSERVESNRENFDHAKGVLASRGIGFIVLTERHIRNGRKHIQAMTLLRYSKAAICLKMRERLKTCISTFEDGLSIAELASHCDATVTDVLQLIATREIAIGPNWVLSNDSILEPASKENHHEVRIENWFDAALW